MAYTNVFVLGDSLVDAGNALELAEWYGGLPLQDLPEGAPVAEDGYFLGRFSDGYNFADLVANKAIGTVTEPIFPYDFEDPWLGIQIDPFASDPNGNNLNFAYGGAQIRNGDEAVPDLDGQTDALRDALDGDIPSGSLILVCMGGNDVRSLAPAGSDPVAQADAYAELRECSDQLLHELSQLIGNGARNIVITGIADVGLIPRYDRNGDGNLDATEQMRSDAATDYSIYLDNLVRTQVVPALQAMGATITYVPLMDYVAPNGTLVRGGLSSILPTIAALNGLSAEELSNNLLQYQDQVFFDQVHPNAQTNALFASYMQSIIAGSPWVETLPLMGANVDYRTTATIGAPGEIDRVTVSLVAGTTYTLEMLGVSSLGTVGSLGDPNLRLLGPGGAPIGANDDSGAGFDATLTFTAATTGNYTLELSAIGSLTGSYSLQGATIGGAAMQQGNTYNVSNASTVIIEGAGGIGQDVVNASVSYVLSAGSEIELLQTNRASAKTAINLTGNEYSQTIIGNAGANVLEGKDGADTFFGRQGNDRFVLSNSAVTSPGSGNIDAIKDYAAGDIVDITQILGVAAGTNIVGGGYLRVTTSGFIQVDLNGGGNEWVTLSTINGTGAITVRYLSGGTATNQSVARVADGGLATASSQIEPDPGAGSTSDRAFPMLDHDGFGIEAWHYPAYADLWF
jgi:phospholipase/lecithinase/hemolysin